MADSEQEAESRCEKPCPQCPWRKDNQGKRHKNGFYTKQNLTRLWNGCRKGDTHSCHLTDPSHPHHIEAGAPENAKAKECPGVVILAIREMKKATEANNEMTPASIDRYLAARSKGLSKDGLLYWGVQRYLMGGVPVMGGPKLPVVDHEDEAIGLPEYLREET